MYRHQPTSSPPHTHTLERKEKNKHYTLQKHSSKVKNSVCYECEKSEKLFHAKKIKKRKQPKKVIGRKISSELHDPANLQRPSHTHTRDKNPHSIVQTRGLKNEKSPILRMYETRKSFYASKIMKRKTS